MFLDSFPLHVPENRATRPVRETTVETGKSRSAWPFIVAGSGFGVSHPALDAQQGMPSVSVSAFSAPDPGSFVT